jgi:hypothetical protein
MGVCMRLKAYIEKHPPKKRGPVCKVCALPRKMRADVDAALACGDEMIVVWRWLRFDQKRPISRTTVLRHTRNCLKIRGPRGTS